jgi:hypothetical protein
MADAMWQTTKKEKKSVQILLNAKTEVFFSCKLHSVANWMHSFIANGPAMSFINMVKKKRIYTKGAQSTKLCIYSFISVNR